MPSRATWMKIAAGVVAVILVYCLLNYNRRSGGGGCRHQMPSAIPVVTAVPVRLPEKFAPYEPEEEEQEYEQYADYVPAQREEYIDAADVYSPTQFKTELLDS